MWRRRPHLRLNSRERLFHIFPPVPCFKATDNYVANHQATRCQFLSPEINYSLDKYLFV
jgi:hypothetical protein